MVDRMRARMERAGPLRVSFDASRMSEAQAVAIGSAVAAEETHVALEALANPIRRKVLERLLAGAASFSEVMSAAALDDSPKLSFHLRKLIDTGLILHEGDRYRLTPRGQAGVRLLVDATFLPPKRDEGNLAFPKGTGSQPARRPPG
jgi:hypothetical protein